MNHIFLGDCLDVIPKHINDTSIDLILCDLPYGVTNHPEDISLPFDVLWKEYKRIIKPNGAIVLFAQGLFMVDLINSNRTWFKYDLIWNKVLTTGFLNANRMPLRQHENILVFYKNKPTYNPQFTVGNPSHAKGTKHLEKDGKNQNYGKYKSLPDGTLTTQKHPTSIVTFEKPHPSVAKHRTAKPVALLEWIIKTYTNKNDVVLDNCAGSGGVAIACSNTNRQYIMIEKNVDIFNIMYENVFSLSDVNVHRDV